MRYAPWKLATCVVALSFGNPAPFSDNIGTPRRGIPPPSEDSFYRVPSNIGDSSPGRILNHRSPPSAISAFGHTAEKFVEKSFQLLYRTSDMSGNATASVVTVLIPPHADFGKVVSLQAAEDAASIDCAPSFGFQEASAQYPKINSPTMQVQELLADAALHRGWPVIIPDAEGPRGVYPSGKTNAYITLDGVRAAISSEAITGIQRNATIVLWGYSGGGSDTLQAVQAQPQYAPELQIAGAALGGVTGSAGQSIAKSISILNKSRLAGLIPVSLLGIAAQSPLIQATLDEHLKPEYRDLFYLPKQQCLEANAETFRNQDILAMFNDSSFLYSLSDHVDEFRVENIAPTVPMFWYQAAKDMLVSASSTTSSIDVYCSSGSNITYLIEKGDSTHTTYGLIGAPAALKWLNGILSAQESTPGCTRETAHTNGVDQGLLGIYPADVQMAILKFAEGSQ
ncbi:Secretory lipase family protein [Akanthomyces lecanii RCEF 1005]|uniref:Secretory lipase family protein n=1 Tax=Akanthomyces lecanii RCEF 1005 TaxID=1081108 RepID=A0A168DS45_CORDF|nr:Secretory lipase family protein [Akanthomyces lecanii RCEF 1005]